MNEPKVGVNQTVQVACCGALFTALAAPQTEILTGWIAVWTILVVSFVISYKQIKRSIGRNTGLVLSFCCVMFSCFRASIMAHYLAALKETKSVCIVIAVALLSVASYGAVCGIEGIVRTALPILVLSIIMALGGYEGVINYGSARAAEDLAQNGYGLSFPILTVFGSFADGTVFYVLSKENVCLEKKKKIYLLPILTLLMVLGISLGTASILGLCCAVCEFPARAAVSVTIFKLSAEFADSAVLLCGCIAICAEIYAARKCLDIGLSVSERSNSLLTFMLAVPAVLCMGGVIL